MIDGALLLSSASNPRVKSVVKLRQRSHRADAGLLLIEGCREITRALDGDYIPFQLFFCRDFVQDRGEDNILSRCREMNVELYECTETVFRKMTYRDHPEALLAVGPAIGSSLGDLELPDNALLLVVESVEKPGNLGTMLRSADAAGVDAVIVCDSRTDINNPNVVRASMGTLFAQPLVVASSEATLAWLKEKGVTIVAATPHADRAYTESDMTIPTAITVGTEQDGLSDAWTTDRDTLFRIPMHGVADSLNVAAAATILLYEAVRQRRK